MNSTARQTPRFHTYMLVALFGMSVGLNGFMALKAYKPELLHSIELAMISPPVLRPDDHIRGVPTASVTVIEYSDFQCPYCAQLHRSLKKLAETSKIRWVYRNFPLASIHPHASDAAEAAECAGQQNKFWQYTDALFDSQGELRTTEYLRPRLVVALYRFPRFINHGVYDFASVGVRFDLNGAGLVRQL